MSSYQRVSTGKKHFRGLDDNVSIGHCKRLFLPNFQFPVSLRRILDQQTFASCLNASIRQHTTHDTLSNVGEISISILLYIL